MNQRQKNILKKINAPFFDKENLNDAELEKLCDYITNYVLNKETANDETSKFGEALLSLHDNIIQ